MHGSVYNPVMRRFARIALHLLLIVTLVAPGFEGPMRAMANASHDFTAGDPKPPCHQHDNVPGEGGGLPCERGCCPKPGCDSSACISTGLVPQVADIAMPNTPIDTSFPWRTEAPPSRAPEAPLRPPIA